MGGDYEEIPVEGEGLATYLRWLATTRPDDSTLVHRFRWTGDTKDWFQTRTSTVTYEATFRALLESEAARRAMPDVLEPSPFPSGNPPNFAEVAGGALHLEGDLATLLVRGGAYSSTAGRPHRVAMKLARDAVHDLIQDRYEDIAVYYSNAPWSPWFWDLPWDQTWILVDRRRAEVTVICTTDTD